VQSATLLERLATMTLDEAVRAAVESRIVEHHVRGEGDLWTLRDVRDVGVVELTGSGARYRSRRST
jgi:hypothetical protein